MVARQNVLVVEDSPESFQLIYRALGTLAHLEWVSTLREAKIRIQRRDVDLVILDLHLPDGNGLELFETLRSEPSSREISVIVLSGQQTILEKVRAFDEGADDYVTKPFSREELRSRIQTRLRKNQLRAEAASNVRLHGVEVDRDRQKTFVHETEGPRDIELTAREFGILCFLMSRPGVVLGRKEILEHVWGPHIHTGERLIDTHISKLKRKLGGAGQMITTIQGFGYRMAPENQAG
jgi:DNA-binding response OmpR family regulator